MYCIIMDTHLMEIISLPQIRSSDIVLVRCEGIQKASGEMILVEATVQNKDSS